MTQRRNQLGGLFDEEPEVPNLEEMDQITYGRLQEVNQARMVIEGRPIKDIFPDLAQPRRAIPTAVRLACRIDPENMHPCWAKWIKQAEKECNTSLRIQEWIDGLVNQTDRDHLPEDVPSEFVITRSLAAVVRLAASIKRDGLINPISLYRIGKRYKIVTGERRWLAYHLLNYVYGDWTLIPSYESNPDVWLQAVENTNREDLTGIALARQFALLLMDLYPEQDWGKVEEYTDEEGSDRVFYAQVADGNEWRIPRNQGQRIADAMGVGYTTLRRFRQILSLPDAIWLQADDEGWSTYALYEWITEDSKRHTVATATVYDDEDESHTVTAITVSPENDTTPTSLWRSDPRPMDVVDERGEVQPAMPKGVAIKPIDTASSADVVAPNVDDAAAVIRKYKIEGPAVEMWNAVDRLLETRNLDILALLDEGDRSSVRKQLFLGITHGLRLFGQMVVLDRRTDQLNDQMTFVYEMSDMLDRVTEEINKYAIVEPPVVIEPEQFIDDEDDYLIDEVAPEPLPDEIAEMVMGDGFDIMDWRREGDRWEIEIAKIVESIQPPMQVIGYHCDAWQRHLGLTVNYSNLGTKKVNEQLDNFKNPVEVGALVKVYDV